MDIPTGTPPRTLPPPYLPAARSRGVVFSVCAVLGLMIFLNTMSWKTAFLIGLGLVALGGWAARRQHLWLKGAQVARGVVVDLVANGDTDTTYKPRFRYTTRTGESREFLHEYGSNDPGYKVGENILVAYTAADGSDARLMTFDARYGLAAGVMAAGIGLALLSAAMVAGRLAMPRVYAGEHAAQGP